MRILATVATLAAFCPAQDQTQDPTFQPKSAFKAFRAEQGGQWIAQWHPATGTPSAIYGTGMPISGWTENSLAAARAHANKLLRDQSTLLGLGTSDFREAISGRMGRSWTFTYDQYFRGLKVIDGRADVRINMSGVVAMLGSKAWPIAADFDTTPAIDADVATATAWNALDAQPTGVKQPAPVAAPRLVIWGDTHADNLAPFYLAWEVSVSNVDGTGDGRIGRFFVDAKTGAVLTFVSDKHECGFVGCNVAKAAPAAAPATTAAMPPVPTTVTVTGWTRTGIDAFAALVNVPIPGLVVAVPGLGNYTTDNNGQFTIDIASPVTISIGTLDGRHHNPISGANAPAANVTVNPGVPASIDLLTAAATANEAAHTSTSYFVDRTNEWCRTILGNSTQLATASNVAVTVNIASTCNAYYTGNTINFYQAGGGCSNTAFSTVVAHEWGHGIDERYGGISNTNAEGMSEGWGDILGCYLMDTPLLGSGFQTAGVALRRGDNTFLYPYSGSSPHAAGQVWMGFAWRLRERLRAAFGTAQAVAISQDIVVSSLLANASTRPDGVREVFIADDNDGNLLNGTPNYDHLAGAATDKAIPYPVKQEVSITHTALGNTSEQLKPRRVDVSASPIAAGSVSQVRVVYNVGAGNVTRVLVPNGVADGYVALLPGRNSGTTTYYFEAVHSNNSVTRLPQTGTFTYTTNVATTGPFVGFYNEGFTAGANGWTAGNYTGTAQDWQLGAPAGKSGTANGIPWADPTAASANGNIYGTDLGNTVWNGQYYASRSYWLRSPAINCSGRTGCFLRFRRWLTVEEGIYDRAEIYVNGTLVWGNPANGNLLDTTWSTVEYAIPMADNQAAVTVEFRITTDGALNLGGWNIDDIELGTKQILLLPAELTMLPEQAQQGATINLAVATTQPTWPYILAIADAPGPTAVPGFPTVQVGGFINLFTGTTDGAGLSTSSFLAPNIPSTTGVFFYSQVVTLDPTFTTFVASNAFVNLFTQ
ncbi:MAG: hypothetical protein FJ301_04335 [Planctomycetes bacterium]|nr:hypothetical protein [Planctomycetota bacterium]